MPVYDPEAGILTAYYWKTLWCRLRGHDFIGLVVLNHKAHDVHMVCEFACARCGFTEAECVECDWEEWWDF